MFKTRLDECGFTLLTSGLMIYIMGVYNVALHTGGLKYATFGMAAHSFPLEWFIGFLLAFFVVSRTAKHFAFKVALPTDRPIFKILCIQTDNGAEFTKKFVSDDANPHLFGEKLKEFGIRHKLIKPFTPRHNGKVERSHRKDNEYFYASHKFYSFLDF